MSRHVVLIQLEAASSAPWILSVLESFRILLLQVLFNKMIETEQKLWSAKGTIFESVNVLLKKRQPCQNCAPWVLVFYI